MRIWPTRSPARPWRSSKSTRTEPFFLYFATHDIHVPRVPHPRFAGKSGLGPRGDVILEFDWSVGAILETLDRLELAGDTLVIFSSDNGPVVDDGYKDQAVELLDGHKPAGPLRGGKYSAFDGGTRVPFVVRWPGRVKPGVSEALACQIDFMASLAALTGQKLDFNDAPDSFDVLGALLGRTPTGRDHLVEHAGTPVPASRRLEVHRAEQRAPDERQHQYGDGQRSPAPTVPPEGRPGRKE